MPDPQADYEIEFDDADKEWMAQQARRDRELAELKARADANAADAEAAEDTERGLAEIQLAAARRAQDPDSGGAGTIVKGTVTNDRTITFMDRDFRIADKVGLMPLLKFASVADMDVNDPRALASMYTMLRDCIHPGTPSCEDCADCEAGNKTQCAAYDRGDWAAFEEHAMVTKAGAEDLLDVVTAVLEKLSGRPTEPPGSSSSRRPSARRNSTGGSSSRRAKGSRR